jgi:hypothetical protein
VYEHHKIAFHTLRRWVFFFYIYNTFINYFTFYNAVFLLLLQSSFYSPLLNTYHVQFPPANGSDSQSRRCLGYQDFDQWHRH